MRVIGRYIDDQKPKEVFFFEVDGAYVLRLLMDKRKVASTTRRDRSRYSSYGAGYGPGFAASRRFDREVHVSRSRRRRRTGPGGVERGLRGGTCAIRPRSRLHRH